ncbi:MAG: tripartite tricarboxylate transporter TctB family protein [Candidatus Atribacteria bacterium]|nr:tripartite tricarboxylate transporter TctB family protein [Candidatus Atribacteria bacterium]
MKMGKRFFSNLIEMIKKEEIIIGVIIFFFSIFVYAESVKLPDFGKSYESPGLLPAFIAVVMLILSLIMIVGEVKKELKLKRENKRPQENMEKESLWNVRILIAIIIILFYIGILPYAGFLVASSIFLFVLMLFLKAGNIFLIGLISVFVPVAIQYLFANILKQLIP